MPTSLRLTAAVLVWTILASACSTKPSAPAVIVPAKMPPPPVEASALRPCPDLPLLNDGSLGDLVDWVRKASKQYADCRSKHNYTTRWIKTARTQWTTPTKPASSKK